MLVFQKLSSPQGKGCSCARAWASDPKATGNGEKVSSDLQRLTPQNRKEQQSLFWAYEESKPFVQQQAHAETTRRLRSDNLYIHTIKASIQHNTEFLGKWEEGGKKEGVKTNSNFFYLLESTIIFTENVVGSYNLENGCCNLPIGNSLKRKSRL